jgi:hypothetical protein
VKNDPIDPFCRLVELFHVTRQRFERMNLRRRKYRLRKKGPRAHVGADIVNHGWRIPREQLEQLEGIDVPGFQIRRDGPAELRNSAGRKGDFGESLAEHPGIVKQF